MDNYNAFPGMAYQPNLYYQSQQPTTPVYTPRNWQQQQSTAPLPSYSQSGPATNLIWIQGENAAKSWYVPNGGKMVFFDSEEPVIYIKSVDISGKPEITILDYTERSNEDRVAQAPVVEYATKEQVDDLNSQLSLLSEKLNSLSSYVSKDQFDLLSSHLSSLSGQVEDIENRITSFGKPQTNSQNNRKGNNK